MKSKKIILYSIIFLFTGTTAMSQKAYLRGGVNFANVTVSNNGDIDKANTLTTFQVGFIANCHIAPFLSIQPGVLFTGKGSKTQAGNTTDNNYYRSTSNPYYIEVPVNLVFKTPTGPIKFFAGAGPYVAMGVAGKNKVNGRFAGTDFSSKDDIKWSNDDPTTLDYEEGSGFGILKRFDYGFDGTAGIEFKGGLISVNYDLGLAKLQSGTNSSDNQNNKNRVFTVTFGVKL